MTPESYGFGIRYKETERGKEINRRTKRQWVGPIRIRCYSKGSFRLVTINYKYAVDQCVAKRENIFPLFATQMFVSCR